MEGQLLSVGYEARRHARLLQRALANRGDQQHVLSHAKERHAGALGEITPAAFRFAIKRRGALRTSRTSSPRRRTPWRFLYRALAALGEKRGPVLFQLPPVLKKDVPRLRAFLELLPPAHLAAFEFRHESWFTDEVYAALKSAGAALCLSEREDNALPPLVETAAWGYVRLRLETYADADLEQWARRLAQTKWSEVYAYFMHEPTAPAYAQALMRFSA